MNDNEKEGLCCVLRQNKMLAIKIVHCYTQWINTVSLPGMVTHAVGNFNF
jgi:hypothetical protein